MSDKILLAHQFEDLEQQRETSVLGMWVFLATEIMFFGGLFATYAIYRLLYSKIFIDASHSLGVFFGALNTGILLCSSFTMALALHAVKVKRRKTLMFFLLLTSFLGCIFLGIKGYEYYEKFREYHVPGVSFKYHGASPKIAELFFWLYFSMTGLHALHVLIGIGVLWIMFFLFWRNYLPLEKHMPVEIAGLYWHFVDIVWVFLFPLLYLVR
ncbi:MAG: cytochrome c oxidase subunit 3 [Verrucomicrobiae bacterium]|nr:cytochrome c oxidase subunit 3 [Verrucomicrobiae bacterium]